MHRVAAFWCLLLVSLSASGQSVSTSPSPTASDPVAVSLAQKSALALTGGAAIADVTLNVNVISIAGSANESGSGTLLAKGIGESRVDLNLSGVTRSDVRNLTNGTPGGAWQKNGVTPTPYAQHNCWTDAAWFFPALSALAQTSNPNFVFKYVGQEQHNGASTQHIRTFQTGSQQIQSLSTMDFYLDSTSSLPLAVAFQARADNDINTQIPAETRFAQYQAVNVVQIPFHFQRLFNGFLSLDVTVTSVSVNTGLSDTAFTLQ